MSNVKTMYDIINEKYVYVGMRFLGCIRPDEDIEELIIKEISPKQQYLRLYMKKNRTDYWVDCRNVGFFEVLEGE